MLREFNEELERRVAERTAALVAANEELRAFSHTVSHDLRAPVRAIAGFARLLERSSQGTLDAGGLHRLDNIARSGETMGRLINDLLAYTRLGQETARAVPVPVEPIVARLTEAHEQRLHELGGVLVLAPDPAVPVADPMLLELILANLVENAVAYHRPGVAPLVTVSSARDGARVRVAVEDNGTGIPADARERIFEVFTRTSPDQELEHAGIGLATVRRAARAMGTDIGLASTVGAGSTFWVDLPAAERPTGA